MKKCCHCQKIKTLSEFCKNRRSKSKDGFHPECRLCVKTRKAKYYLQNKEKVYNLDKQRKYIRRKTNILVRLKDTLRARIRGAVLNNQKNGSAVRDLGCSVKEFKLYLEERFQPGMSWKNYGNKKNQWNIDHRIPLSKVDLSNREELLKVCHYTNLQPMWAIDNIIKSNKI